MIHLHLWKLAGDMCGSSDPLMPGIAVSSSTTWGAKRFRVALSPTHVVGFADDFDMGMFCRPAHWLVIIRHQRESTPSTPPLFSIRPATPASNRRCSNNSSFPQCGFYRTLYAGCARSCMPNVPMLAMRMLTGQHSSANAVACLAP